MSTLRVRRLGADWEPTYGNGQNDYLFDGEAVSQILVSRLRLWLAEWWEDTALGLPMMQKILGQRISSKSIVDRLIQKEITRKPYIGVTGIKSFVSTYNAETRNYSCTVYVYTIYGIVAVTTGG